MVRGGRESQCDYLREWRKSHPHYHRDWARRKRGYLKVKGSKKILGFRVQPGGIND